MFTAAFGEFLAQLGMVSAQMSALCLLSFVVARLLGRNLSPRWRCGLWLLVVGRLAWPFSLPSPVSIFNLLEAPFRETPPNWMPFYLPGELARVALRAVQQPWVVALWAGLALLLGLKAFSQTVVSRRLLARSRPVRPGAETNLLEACSNALKIRKHVRLVESDQVVSPCVAGFLRPGLILPAGLVGELTHEELRLIFLHELAHVRHWDLAVNWLLAGVETLHWFNPLVWLSTREFRAAREEACDETALAANPNSANTYGKTLLKLLERDYSNHAAPAFPTLGALGQPDSLGALHRRFRAIVGFRPGLRTWVAGLGVWLLVAAVGYTDAEPPQTAPAVAENPAPLLTDPGAP